mmetsp:Transcript_78062/g.155145  ORF Transcript_78062/g.155145 Transcript_78062/m.155145 type:complete len:86 (+) Transcript_78062:605-862(+)
MRWCGNLPSFQTLLIKETKEHGGKGKSGWMLYFGDDAISRHASLPTPADDSARLRHGGCGGRHVDAGIASQWGPASQWGLQGAAI